MMALKKLEHQQDDVLQKKAGTHSCKVISGCVWKPKGKAVIVSPNANAQVEYKAFVTSSGEIDRQHRTAVVERTKQSVFV